MTANTTARNAERQATAGAAREGTSLMRIDRFTCPRDQLAAFKDRLAIIHHYLEGLDGCLYSRIAVSESEEDARIVTVVEWRDQTALADARAAVNRFYEKLGFDPAAFLTERGIKGDFGTYGSLKP